MVFRPEVFVSGSPSELGTYRKVVQKVLRQIGAKPVEHSDVSVPYGPLNGVLKVAIDRCEAVIHLAGFRFGAEPRERTHGAPRRSFSQYEVDVALALKKPVYFFLAAPGLPT